MPTNRGLGKGLGSLIPQKQGNPNSATNQFPATSPPRPNEGRKFESQPKGGRNRGQAYTRPPVDKNAETKPPTQSTEEGTIIKIPLEKIVRNPYQPRGKFDEEKIRELAASIQKHGIISPLVVTQAGDKYELIAGERRLRASKIAGLTEVLVIVRKVDEQEKFELALIENIQRENLNVIELGKAYKRLIDEFRLTQEKVAKRIGTSRSHVANILRLLHLPVEIKDSLEKGELSEGHAKLLVSIPTKESQLSLWKKIVANKLTVRVSDKESRQIKVKEHARSVRPKDAQMVALENKLEGKFGTKVTVTGTLDKGRIHIEYYSREELKGILGQ